MVVILGAADLHDLGVGLREDNFRIPIFPPGLSYVFDLLTLVDISSTMAASRRPRTEEGYLDMLQIYAARVCCLEILSLRLLPPAASLDVPPECLRHLEGPLVVHRVHQREAVPGAAGGRSLLSGCLNPDS